MLRDLPEGEECHLSGNYRLRSLELSPSPASQCVRGNMARDTADCAGYLVCQGGKYERQECQEGLHWNRVSISCFCMENKEGNLLMTDSSIHYIFLLGPL